MEERRPYRGSVSNDVVLSTADKLVLGGGKNIHGRVVSSRCFIGRCSKTRLPDRIRRVEASEGWVGRYRRQQRWIGAKAWVSPASRLKNRASSGPTNRKISYRSNMPVNHRRVNAAHTFSDSCQLPLPRQLLLFSSCIHRSCLRVRGAPFCNVVPSNRFAADFADSVLSPRAREPSPSSRHVCIPSERNGYDYGLVLP